MWPWHVTCSAPDVVLAATEEHGLSEKALHLAHPFGIPITNSMVVTWTIFIFILAANWIGLVPGVGSIGWGHHAGAH